MLSDESILFFLKRILLEKLIFIEPDFERQKENHHLLIWKNIPHWMVVDSEFYQFLKNCNGSNSVGEILKKLSGNESSGKKVISQINDLILTGIFEAGQNRKKENKQQNKTNIPIENVAVNVTQKCNLRCALCYNIDSLSNNSDGELSSDEIISFLKETIPFLSKRPSLSLVGGEPLEVPDKVIAIAEYAIKHRFNTLVSTNGIKITDEFARRAKRIGLEVQVSIDGHNADTNDVVRGKGSFEKAIKGVKTLVRNGTHTTLSMVYHSGNFKYLQDYYEMAAFLGVDEARFIPLKKLGGGQNEKFQPVNISDMIKESLSMFKHNRKLQKLMGRDCFTILANTCRFSSKRLSCGTGLQTLLLDSDGSIYPCLNTQVEELRAANIRDENFSFKRFWENSPILQNVRELTNVQNPDNPCSKCLVRHWCLGGCRGETYINKGKLNTKAVNCSDLRDSILDMFWILSDNNDWIKSMSQIG